MCTRVPCVKDSYGADTSYGFITFQTDQRYDSDDTLPYLMHKGRVAVPLGLVSDLGIIIQVQ